MERACYNAANTHYERTVIIDKYANNNKNTHCQIPQLQSIIVCSIDQFESKEFHGSYQLPGGGAIQRRKKHFSVLSRTSLPVSHRVSNSINRWSATPSSIHPWVLLLGGGCVGFFSFRVPLLRVNKKRDGSTGRGALYYGARCCGARSLPPYVWRVKAGF